ncbi:MAG: type IV secretion system DNA-binding domain-containing protein [Candidatus Nomurabacteria bacterium]|nr:type IV secretion system DNA-binding domain-containing protein [Candidatus Nomurabacteria bacterium]USN87980.1 MAG: type IV secretion system DNA-binding domain-containing protein [Candidatus Nomurabacteria bacterium]
MPEGIPKKFTSPEEEISYLREQIAARERELLARSPEVDQADIETVGKQEIREYASFTPRSVLDPKHKFAEADVAVASEQVALAADPVEEIVHIALEKGIRNALSVLEKTDNAYIIDQVHRRLVEQIRSGVNIQDIKEGMPTWHLLHMTLYELTLPETKAADGREYQLSELIGMMEQLFAGLRNIGSEQSHNHFAIEIAVADFSDDIVFYVAVPNQFVTLFEKQVLSLFPHAELTVQAHDYNIFVDQGVTLISELKLKKHPIYPIRTHDGFTSDPLAVILNAFSKIEREGGGAAVQFLMRYPQKKYNKSYSEVIKNMQKGMKAGEAISRSTIGGEIMGSLSDLIFSKKPKEGEGSSSTIESDKIEVFSRKVKSEIVETNIRIAVSARDSARAEQILGEIESTFNQFDLVDGNSFAPKRAKGSLKSLQKAFAFREFWTKAIIPFNLTELSTLIHFPGNGVLSSPQFKQSHANTAAAPNDMPTEGTLLGINNHRNSEREIYITNEDRLRHFYIIGQTGTGKTTLMKNMITQDILRGDGVCMIDPHGTDIEDVLSAVPKEREQDVIYFDPSRLDRILALNMLEYDITKPEQKTFVVNELFSIFQKLYGANPESMGPMFEQYFRNATLLVMEDPDSGNTLMDISRVMADAKYRRMKLEKATNPVVVQFWREIASKAGGEASLENIVPYIVSKFDVFTANDYMRPIIGQQKSAFNFRQVMDERKILLVNLSKGRLGEINANLIGMIIVGKILMAALSRVDDPTRGFAPFYLHMDEFQNVSTNSISAILSEARKYKLGLTIAHQFIAQLDPNIKDAVFGNVGSMAAFRVGPEDAQFLEHQFSPPFNASNLMNIPNRNALVRILANGTPTKPFNIKTMPPPPTDLTRINEMIELSYHTHGRPRAEVEAEISARYAKETPLVL